MEIIHRLLDKLQLVVELVVTNLVVEVVDQEDLVEERHIQVVVEMEHLVREILVV